MAETLQSLLIAKGEADVAVLPKMANRHGLIAGATGTGKTVTLRVLAERFSSIGVPVFMADVKGDLSGLAREGGDHAKIRERAEQLGITLTPEAFPVVFWDLFGEAGHPVRTTISEMGPLLLSRILSLNDTQEGVLSVVFRIADDNGLLLLDLKDLRSMLQFVGDNAQQFRTGYGNVSPASIGAIQRGLLALEEQGGDGFFGEPALNLDDFIQTEGGKGVVNILNAQKLMRSPRLYATFLLWLLSELFESLPEVGDPAKPKLVFFFDEAHLLFEDVPQALEDKIEQVVRLIRSKGVGVWFVTQNPIDIPDTVLGQLGNRVQHALRAYTPREQRAIKAASETFRPNPKVDVGRAILDLGVGEALISVLDPKGAPTVVERAFVCPPASRMAPLDPQEVGEVIRGSAVRGVYEKTVDRESAHEMLREKAARMQEEAAAAREAEIARKEAEAEARRRPVKSQAEILGGALAKSAAHAIGSQLGRQILRGVLGGLFGGGRSTTRR